MKNRGETEDNREEREEGKLGKAGENEVRRELDAKRSMRT
jgi:hypothetical protein